MKKNFDLRQFLDPPHRSEDPTSSAPIFHSKLGSEGGGLTNGGRGGTKKSRNWKKNQVGFKDGLL